MKQDMVDTLVAQTLEQINNHESTYEKTPNLRKAVIGKALIRAYLTNLQLA